jgi:hypothetical protein
MGPDATLDLSHGRKADYVEEEYSTASGHGRDGYAGIPL